MQQSSELIALIDATRTFYSLLQDRLSAELAKRVAQSGRLADDDDDTIEADEDCFEFPDPPPIDLQSAIFEARLELLSTPAHATSEVLERELALMAREWFESYGAPNVLQFRPRE